jgi:hypothetical protein
LPGQLKRHPIPSARAVASGQAETTFRIPSPKRKKPSVKDKSSSAEAVRGKQECSVPLLPEVRDYHVESQRQTDKLTIGGQILVRDPCTTEALIDKLERCVVSVRDQEQDLPVSSFIYDRKYLNRAIAVIKDWSKVELNVQHHQFIFNLSDIRRSDQRLVAELIDLDRTASSTLSRALHEVVKRLFSMVSAGWFYESAAEEIQVIFEP